jgi:hypothetical protein
MKICHGAWGLQGMHTFFIVDVLSTKTAILVDNWLLASSWLVISSIILRCFFSKAICSPQKRPPYDLGMSQKLCFTTLLALASVVGLVSGISPN